MKLSKVKILMGKSKKLRTYLVSVNGRAERTGKQKSIFKVTRHCAFKCVWFDRPGESSPGRGCVWGGYSGFEVTGLIEGCFWV